MAAAKRKPTAKKEAAEVAEQPRSGRSRRAPATAVAAPAAETASAQSVGGEGTVVEAATSEGTAAEGAAHPSHGAELPGTFTGGSKVEVGVHEAAPIAAPIAAPVGEASTDRRWYVIHAYSGHEDKVRDNLLKRVENLDMQEKIFSVLVPKEEEIEIKDGQRRHVQKRIYPGYVLVEMKMDDEAWYVVRNTPGVTSFVGSGNQPIPLQESEVRAILKQIRAEAPKVRVEFAKGQAVRVIDGPFTDFTGKIEEMNTEKGKIKVLVNMFGRETPVELDLLQVEKV
jgi:transcriptional antiterminator NusG